MNLCGTEYVVPVMPSVSFFLDPDVGEVREVFLWILEVFYRGKTWAFFEVLGEVLYIFLRILEVF